MGTTKLSITYLLLLSVFLLSTSFVLSARRVEDDWEKELQQELQKCKQQMCRQLKQEEHQKQCEQKCQEMYEELRRQHKGGNEGRDESRRPDPQQQYREEEREKELQQCRQQCRQQQGQQQQWQCEQECRERYDEEARLEECRQQCSRRHRSSPEEQWKCQRKCQQEREEREHRPRQGDDGISSEEENNPYFFGQESFIHRVRTQHGSIRVLQNFLKKSELLMGIANYRLAIFEADPRTFAVPKQSDAEQIFFVTQGEGTVTLLRNEEESRESHHIRRESHNIRKGEIIRVRAGTVVYIINSSNNQKLQIVKLVQPVSTPGRFEDFYIGGGDNPESFYRTFSTRILEAALNTQQEKLERLFGRQKEGEIIEASEEQIRAMSGQPSEGGQKPFNLLQKRPDHCNQRGQLYTADFNDYEELRDLDVHVSFTNITGGSMMAPFFESKATMIVMVVDGQAEFEMVCPHLSSQGQEEGSQYQKVTSRLTQGNVFIIPAGHPTAIVASQEENLQVVFFKVHAKNNRMVFLAGRNNVVNQMEREAKELSFGVPSQLVEDVFGGSKDELFVRGPKQSRERRPFWSLLAFE